jgi:large subunit ribosomal protein L4e
MFAPMKTWRRWHRRVNLNEKRHAVCSALAASAVTAIVSARGHRIDATPEIPLVVSDEIETVDKTKQAVQILSKLGLGEDIKRCIDGKQLRAGKGKNRGRRYKTRRGALIVHACPTDQMRAFRAIAGVNITHVSRMNLLQLAPGGVAGRMLVFSKAAFEQIEEVYRTKANYKLRRPILSNDDIERIIDSPEIQSVLLPSKNMKRTKHKLNPLKNLTLHDKLNPAAPILRERAAAKQK